VSEPRNIPEESKAVRVVPVPREPFKLTIYWYVRSGNVCLVMYDAQGEIERSKITMRQAHILQQQHKIVILEKP
jgi:hypothetical protein